MSDVRETVSLADLVARNVLAIGDGHRAKLDELGGSGPLFLRAGALSSRGFDWDGLDSFRSDAPLNLEAKLGQPGDVVITTKGNSIGRVGWVPVNTPDFVYSPHLSYWRSLDESVLVSRYLYFWAQSTGFHSQLRGLAYGTDMAPYLSLRDQHSLLVQLPTAWKQQVIAEVLGALDDKIAANDRVLRVSDGLVRAKFDALHESTISFADLADNIRRHVSPDSVDPRTPYVGLEHIPRREMWLADHEAAVVVTSAKSAFVRGDVLFGKLRPYFHKVVWAPTSGITSTDVLVVRAKDPALSGYVLAAAAADHTIRETTTAAEGTRMPRTKWTDLGSVAMPWPGDAEARAFSAGVLNVAASAAQLSEESRVLARTRDELLPLLMSGKVRVKDVERVVEEVT